MSHEIDQITEIGTPKTPNIKPFERMMPYADFVALNETQKLVLMEFYRSRAIYYAGIALSGTLVGFTIGFFTNDFSSSTAQFMAGVALCTNFFTFTGLRSRYRMKDKFLRIVIQMRYDNKVMRDQDKEALCKFAKAVKMPERVQEIIKSGEYLPYTDAEINTRDKRKQQFHEFSKAQYRHLMRQLITTIPDLECYMVFGLAMTFSAVLWHNNLSILLNVALWFVTLLFGVFSILSIIRSHKIALRACTEGKTDEVMAKLTVSKPYGFFKVGDHLLHLFISGFYLLTVFPKISVEPTRNTILVMASLFTLLCTLYVMKRSVESANRYRAANPKKAK